MNQDPIQSNVSTQHRTSSLSQMTSPTQRQDLNQKKSNKSLIMIIVVILFFFMVVPAGIIAAMTLTGLNSARNKADDARIKSDISQMRNAAEIYYEKNNYSYIGLANDPSIGPLATDIKEYGSELKIQGLSTSTYVAYAQLVASRGIWCSDYTGFSGEVTSVSPTQTSCK